jgi:uncharacterized protein (DUF302 family)
MKKLNLLFVGILFSVFVSNAQVGTEPKMGENYTFSKIVEGTVETVTVQLKDALKTDGFGVVTEIDMDKTLKEKMDVDYKPYKILGVCNATYAYQILKIEENTGVFLPCKMVVKQMDENTVEVVALNPSVLMQAMGNMDLSRVADQVTEKLQKVVDNL